MHHVLRAEDIRLAPAYVGNSKSFSRCSLVDKFDIARATRLMTRKLVGYAEVIHALVSRFDPKASIVLFGGQAKERPYPGSTTVSTVNGGIATMVHTLAVELAPLRVNAIHPGVVGDSPAWSGKPPEVLERVRVRTPTGRLATMEDIAGAVIFLLENQAVNGVNLSVDGGWLLLWTVTVDAIAAMKLFLPKTR
jgi:NAD(P)-dependent dehydrogenase (short-subunit alcohol dehydrogenase family)